MTHAMTTHAMRRWMRSKKYYSYLTALALLALVSVVTCFWVLVGALMRQRD